MEMIPLDPAFNDAKRMPPTDAELIASIVERVKSKFPDSTVEWDGEAGDSWVMINNDDINLVMLNATIPLIFAKPHVAEYILRKPDRAVLVIERDFASRRFSICPDTVLHALNLIWPTKEVDPAHFSLAELSWATI